MIHVRAVKVMRGGKRGPLHSFHASTGFGPPNPSEQIRRGVLLSTVASVLVLVGCLLTWLVYTEMFGSKVPIMGPLVLGLGLLLLVLAIRQFYIAWKQKKKADTADKTTTAPADDDDMPCENMLEMDTWDTGEGEHRQHIQSRQPSHLVNSSIISPCARIPITYTTLPHLQSIIQPIPLPPGYAATQPSQAAVSPTDLATPGVATDEVKGKSCGDLSSMAKSGSVEVPNPRPVIRYSQGQLELLDREVAAKGRTSPTLVASAPSHHSLGERSTSPHERSSHKSLSLSIERTDVLETI